MHLAAHISCLACACMENASESVLDQTKNDVISVGFTLDSEKQKLIPVMMTKDPMSVAVIEMVSCNCKTDC